MVINYYTSVYFLNQENKTIMIKNSFSNSFLNDISSIYRPFERSKTIYTAFIGVFWFCTFIFLWSLAPVLIPTPLAVGSRLVEFVTDLDFYRDIISSLLLTCKAMLLSIIISSIFAYLSVTSFFRPLAHILVKLRFMSLMGFIFTFTLVLKAGGEVKIGLLMFGIIPFFTLSLLSVIDRIPQKEFDLWTTLRYSKWQQVYEIIIRGKADYTIEAIRANFAMGWLMITMVESFSMSDGGIGVLLFRYNKYNQLDKIFALQIIIFGLGVLFDYLLQRLRYSSFPHTALAEKK